MVSRAKEREMCFRLVRTLRQAVQNRVVTWGELEEAAGGSSFAKKLCELSSVGIGIGINFADTVKIYDANDLFLDMIGYTREELNQGVLNWRQVTAPEFHSSGERALQELFETGIFRPFKKEYVRKDGSHVPALISGTLLDRATSRYVCFILDLRERKELENELLQFEPQSVPQPVKRGPQSARGLVDCPASAS